MEQMLLKYVKVRCWEIINNYFVDYTNENKIEHIPDHLYKTSIIGGSGSGKTKRYVIFEK